LCCSGLWCFDASCFAFLRLRLFLGTFEYSRYTYFFGHPLRSSSFLFTIPASEEELALTRLLFGEYAQQLGIDLCFQNFDAELDDLPGEYASPRGSLLLAWVDGQLAGCCALRQIDNVDYSNAAEMKRLYVRNAFRRSGLGRHLAEATLDAARAAGYHCVLLDTLDNMETARALYVDIGFTEIPPFYHNPLPGAHYLKVDL
jgi:ribosomal protein S18 acetylase RimI-like enzyme